MSNQTPTKKDKREISRFVKFLRAVTGIPKDEIRKTYHEHYPEDEKQTSSPEQK